MQQLGDQYGIAEDHRYSDWKDLVASGDLDVLSIATPTTLHAPIAVAALDAHVAREPFLVRISAAKRARDRVEGDARAAREGRVTARRVAQSLQAMAGGQAA